MRCCRPDCAATLRHFDESVAQGERQRYRAKGLDKRARKLVGALGLRIDGASILDVGSGLGLVSFELLTRGAATATLCDASMAYLDAAREEATERGLGDRIRIAEGDFVETAARLGAADVVVLDRSVCCYPAWQPLLEAAAARCTRALGLTYPHHRPDIRAVLAFENLRRRWTGDRFRAFVHDPSAMDGTLRRAGFRRVSQARTFAWKIDVYERLGDMNPSTSF